MRTFLVLVLVFAAGAARATSPEETAYIAEQQKAVSLLVQHSDDCRKLMGENERNKYEAQAIANHLAER